MRFFPYKVTTPFHQPTLDGLHIHHLLTRCRNALFSGFVIEPYQVPLPETAHLSATNAATVGWVYSASRFWRSTLAVSTYHHSLGYSKAKVPVDRFTVLVHIRFRMNNVVFCIVSSVVDFIASPLTCKARHSRHPFPVPSTILGPPPRRRGH